MKGAIVLLFLKFILVATSYKYAKRQVQHLHLSSLEKSIIYSPIVIKCLVRQAKRAPRAKEFIACGIVEEVLRQNSKKIPKRICLTWELSRRFRWKPEEHIFSRNTYIFSLQHDLIPHYSVFKATDAVLKKAKEILSDCSTSVAKAFPYSCGPARFQPRLPNGVLRINEGESLTIPCNPNGKTPFIKEWRLPKKIHRHRGSRWLYDIRYLQNGDVFLGSAREIYAGNYTCEVRNALGIARKSYMVEVVAAQCGGVINLGSGQTSVLQSPNYPRSYPRDKLCKWHFCPQTGKFLEISFQEFLIHRGKKNPLLRRNDDKFSVTYECKGKRSAKKLSYCGKRTPGKITSLCPSGCVGISFKSGFGSQRGSRARGFDATVKSVDSAQHRSEMQRIFCSSDFVIKAKTSVDSQGKVRHLILETYKASSSITGSSLQSKKRGRRATDIFGCWMNIRGINYLFGKRNKSGRFKTKYITKAKRMPPEFIKELQQFKKATPSC